MSNYRICCRERGSLILGPKNGDHSPTNFGLRQRERRTSPDGIGPLAAYLPHPFGPALLYGQPATRWFHVSARQTAACRNQSADTLDLTLAHGPNAEHQ